MLLTDFLHRQGGLDDLGRRLVVCEGWSFDQRSVLVSVSGWFQSRPYNVTVVASGAIGFSMFQGQR